MEKVELNKLRVSLKDSIFLKIKEFWNQNIGSFDDYVTWGTLLTTILAPVEYIVVYIAAKKRFRFITEEEFQKDSEFWLSRLNTEEEKRQTKTILLKEFGIKLT